LDPKTTALIVATYSFITILMAGSTSMMTRDASKEPIQRQVVQWRPDIT
jgi:hypothetical protein